ncbi:hypothetical protein E2P81_ATG03542 [Venturia nashicola]|uniref:Uncharacterized protein n=1 Tax=Venturia nashicola TaxID=86259 RepID=A0A4Z1PSG6_9PEZI|nr:hypothetical protein E6O75_ATG03617 [Venturia nashicola]TLD37867.1 hypothetical protein E2P81_ATG03542 [Venturia nashicola]
MHSLSSILAFSLLAATSTASYCEEGLFNGSVDKWHPLTACKLGKANRYACDNGGYIYLRAMHDSKLVLAVDRPRGPTCRFAKLTAIVVQNHTTRPPPRAVFSPRIPPSTAADSVPRARAFPASHAKSLAANSTVTETPLAANSTVNDTPLSYALGAPSLVSTPRQLTFVLSIDLPTSLRQQFRELGRMFHALSSTTSPSPPPYA